MQILNARYVALIWYFVLQEEDDIEAKNFMDALVIQNAEEYAISVCKFKKGAEGDILH